jgi:GT2 family glycosyltransferase
VKADILNCLWSIKDNKPSCEFETVVVDNASTDGSVEAIKKEFPEVLVIPNNNNRGFSAANNQAIKVAKGNYLLLLNPDTIIHKDSIDNLINVLDENPDAGACGPKIINADGTIYHSVKRIITFRGLLYGKTVFKYLGIFRRHYKKLKPHNFNYDKQAEVKRLSGAVLLIRQVVMNQIKGMDEDFFLYYEDVDLCLRIRKAGWRIIYTPNASITHLGGKSFANISAKKQIILYRSLFIYLRKHKGALASTLFNLVFKPAVIMKDIINIFTALAAYIFSVVSLNQKKRVKSLAKIRNTIVFLSRCSWQFLFKT